VRGIVWGRHKNVMYDSKVTPDLERRNKYAQFASKRSRREKRVRQGSVKDTDTDNTTHRKIIKRERSYHASNTVSMRYELFMTKEARSMIYDDPMNQPKEETQIPNKMLRA